MITGSVALSFYAQPRMTRDIDVVIECEPDDAPRIVDLFKPDCYVEEAEIREAVTHASMFNIIHNEWIVKADFIVRKDDDYRRLEFGRRKEIRIGAQTLFIVSPEDLILSKLAWSRDSGSELQMRDVRSLLRAVTSLDQGYLEKWAAVLGVAKQLAEARV
jgi:hypothetical protein